MTIEIELKVQDRPAAADAPPVVPVRTPAVPVPARMLRRAIAVATFGIVQVGRRDQLDVRTTRTWPSGYKISFIAMVVAPALIAWVYLAFLASDQYVAETRFAIRTVQIDTGESSSDKLKAATSGGALNMAGQDAYLLAIYIRSRAIIDDLDKQVDIRGIFTRPEGDFWARLKRGASAEELLTYWQSMVSARVDSMSGVVTVAVRSFRPADSVAIAAAIVEVSEKLVNEISERARQDALKRGQDEVRRADEKVETALANLRDYRDKEGYLDPIVAATSTAKLLSEAMSQKYQLENDLFVATRSVSADAPQLKSMRTRLVGIDQQIDQLKAELTGNSAQRQTVAASLTKFEELELQRVFAEKMYTMAQDGLERARKKAEQQNIYISVFVPPSLPEDAKYPERLSLSLITPIALLIIWGIIALMAASIDDHRN